MKEFWTQQAKTYKLGVKAVNFDPLMEEFELHHLLRLIPDKKVVCDLGCGNGRTTVELAVRKKKCKLCGIDFVKEMIDAAEEQKKIRKAHNVNFFVADAGSRELNSRFGRKFDFLYTKRLLINLKGEEKFRAIENIHGLLKAKGIFVMIECFLEPLERINKVRSLLGLEEIKVKVFNEYLRSDFIKKIEKWFVVKDKVDFGSLYYFTSRVYNAALTNGNPDYFSPLNKLSAEITKKHSESLLDGYCPEVLFILERK